MAWTVFISVLCLISMDTFSSVQSFDFMYKDKVVHAAFYFIFTIVWYLFFKKQSHSKYLKLKTFAFAVIYGIFIEICQGVFTHERSADVIDVLANTLGSSLAIMALWLADRNKK